MRLILHNHLLDGNGKPYTIKDATTKVILKTYDTAYISKILSSVDLAILYKAINDLGIEIEPVHNINKPTDEELQVLHHVLFEIEVLKGYLISEDGKKFQIVGGIPDMETEL